MTADEKTIAYEELYKQLESFFEITDDTISKMATIAALLHQRMEAFSWTGFYRYIEGALIVGPYQGPVACRNLMKDTGVCWAAYTRQETVIVDDVTKFDGHIACDSRTKSEIVVPCKDADGKVFAVFDIDSVDYGTFDEIDRVALEKIVKLIC